MISLNKLQRKKEISNKKFHSFRYQVIISSVCPPSLHCTPALIFGVILNCKHPEPPPSPFIFQNENRLGGSHGLAVSPWLISSSLIKQETLKASRDHLWKVLPVSLISAFFQTHHAIPVSTGLRHLNAPQWPQLFSPAHYSNAFLWITSVSHCVVAGSWETCVLPLPVTGFSFLQSACSPMGWDTGAKRPGGHLVQFLRYSPLLRGFWHRRCPCPGPWGSLSLGILTWLAGTSPQMTWPLRGHREQACRRRVWVLDQVWKHSLQGRASQDADALGPLLLLGSISQGCYVLKWRLLRTRPQF